MPYKREGETIYVRIINDDAVDETVYAKKQVKWKKLYTHTTELKAHGHLTALRIAEQKEKK